MPSAIGQEQKLGEGPSVVLNYANLLLLEGHTGLCPIFVALHEGHLGNNKRGISTAPLVNPLGQWLPLDLPWFRTRCRDLKK